jgi:hypothetical protein
VKRGDVEVLLFRMQAAYPSSTVATAGTLEEWVDSAIMQQESECVFGAFAQWRDREMYPPRVSELLIETQAFARQMAAERNDRSIEERTQYVDGELRTFECGGCLDAGFLPCLPADPLNGEPDFAAGVYPCPDCRPDQYRRWKEGHFVPGHTCSECVALKLGRRRPA